MTPSDRRAAQIFLAATELDGEARQQLVARLCGRDGALRREVESLLESADESDEYFSDLSERLAFGALLPRPDAESAAEVEDRWTGIEVGQTVGPYTLDARIGEGGMGTVWRADRSDGRFEGRVAIKLLHLSGGAAAVQRFELEGRYLAQLSHPNIARLLDAGIGPQSAPYLVLEYVDGEAIDRYCDEHRLSIDRRIGLFLDVLGAVTHAHTHLIVHRDLKPSNILVAEDGTVKLLDFGVAKILGGAGHDLPSEVTREVGTALTPAFASPEQLAGEAITTATDVYSLGLILALILTGRTPRRWDETRGFAALREAAQIPPPPLPELVVDPLEATPEQVAERRGSTLTILRRALQGDLDNIVRKALAVDPHERYTTVADLAADLRRYLRHEPVTAQPPTLGYRVQKFVRRHRGGVLVACLTTLALVAAICVTTWQAIEANRQRDLARYEQQRARASNEFFSLLLEEIGPSGEPLSPVELLDRGTAMLEQQYGSEARFIGRLLYEVSKRYQGLDEDDRALELLGRAEEIARRQGDADLLAVCLCAETQVTLLAQPERARALAEEGVAALEGVRDPSIESLVACVRAEARLLEADGDREGAIEVLSHGRRAVEAHPTSSTHLYTVLLNDLALMQFRTNRVAEALALLEKILQAIRDSGRGNTLGYIRVLSNYGVALSTAGEVLGQQAVWDEIGERARSLELAGRAPPTFAAQRAITLVQLSRFEEALVLFEEAHRQAEERGDLMVRAMTDLNIGQVLVALERHEEAEARLADAEAVLRQHTGSLGRHINTIDNVRAHRFRRQGQIEEARRRVRAVLDRLGYPERRDNSSLMGALGAAARVELDAEEYAVAERFASDRLQAAEAKARAPRRSFHVGEALAQRAEARLGVGDGRGAIADLEAAVEALSHGIGPNSRKTNKARERLAEARRTVAG